MKLAVFFPSSLFCSWSMSYGLVDALRALGHDVTAHPIKPGHPCDALTYHHDGVIISGPEHLKPIGRSVCPTVAWLHETVEREDYGKLDVDQIKRTADVVFCPAIQDEKYGFKWLPLGVNTEIFKPDPAQEKTIDAGFIGLLYPKRQQFLKELQPYLNGIKLHVGNVQVTEGGQWNPRSTVERYAHAIRSIKVFVNLPSLSQVAVSKVYEVLACGTFLLTPCVDEMYNFNVLDACIYNPNRPDAYQHLSKEIKYYSDAEEREAIAQRQAKHTAEHHDMKLRCQSLVESLQQCGAKAA